MRVMNSHRLTIFQGVKIEVAEFMMRPNEESMEHAQARGSMPCGCARESRCRRWLSRMRAWKEEYDVCSSLPRSFSVAVSDLMKVSQSKVEWDRFDICCAWCFGHENV